MSDPKVSLITTTIYVPTVLKLYRDIDEHVTFYVMGDKKTPHDETRRFVESLGNSHYYSDKDQENLGYESSPIIGWNKIMRRNIALLEALKNGADIIVTIDDDNIPMNENYFNDYLSIFTRPFRGMAIDSDLGWFNAGDFMTPNVYHRGFPYDLRNKPIAYSMTHASGSKIGVALGMWCGDPDISAMERITNKPTVLEFSQLLQEGIILKNNQFGPFNSQNTAYIRELAPLMMVLVGVGRYDDIWASYIAERVMMSTEYHCHFGKPFVWQERNAQNLWKNLKDEMFGMEYTETFCSDLMSSDIGNGSVIDKLERLYSELSKLDYLPPVVHELGSAWCKDIRNVL